MSDKPKEIKASKFKPENRWPEQMFKDAEQVSESAASATQASPPPPPPPPEKPPENKPKIEKPVSSDPDKRKT